jgi:hypothetical protein
MSSQWPCFGAPDKFRWQAFSGEHEMSFGLYIAGFVVVIAGLIYGTTILHVSIHWIAVGATIMLGILSGIKATRQKDSGGA